jgi:hypothetical protein
VVIDDKQPMLSQAEERLRLPPNARVLSQKALAVLFLCMSILSLPALVMFCEGSADDAAEKAYQISTSNGLMGEQIAWLYAC